MVFFNVNFIEVQHTYQWRFSFYCTCRTTQQVEVSGPLGGSVLYDTVPGVDDAVCALQNLLRVALMLNVLTSGGEKSKGKKEILGDAGCCDLNWQRYHGCSHMSNPVTRYTSSHGSFTSTNLLK